MIWKKIKQLHITASELPAASRIKYALESSEIDFIQRLDLQAKSELIQEICSIKAIQLLSGTQLDAFTGALFSAVHCTQGPPGTGKSYIGVCLVLALNLIRKKAESKGHAVGPVLVLSYKNHALDEFLLDVISQYNSSNRSNRPNFIRWDHCATGELQPGMLIRTGNPEIESLNNFRERHSPLELSAKQHLTSIIDVLRNSRNFRKLLYDCARSLETIALSDVSLKKYVFNILVHQYVNSEHWVFSVSGCIFLKHGKNCKCKFFF